MNRLLLLVFCISGITSCSNKNKMPSGILSQDQMQAVLWDMLNAQAYTTSFIKKDSSANIGQENLKLQKEILIIHHISKDDFYKSYDYYKNHPELLQTVLDSMTAKADRNRDIQNKINVKSFGENKYE